MPKAEITLRRADLRDANDLFHVHREAVKAMCSGHYTYEQIDIWFTGRSPDMYFSEISAGQIRLASVSGVTVGFVEYATGEVSKLFVLNAYSGMGIGQRLLLLGIEKAQQTGQPVIVIATLNSQRFYERHGFVKIHDTYFVRGDTELHYDVAKMAFSG